LFNGIKDTFFLILGKINKYIAAMEDMVLSAQVNSVSIIKAFYQVLSVIYDTQKVAAENRYFSILLPYGRLS
jgi:hypothetical protein